MTLFAHPTGQESVSGESNDAPEAVPEAPVKRPPRWSVSNWPVRWKVLAIALVPMVLAMLFGGLRISAATSDASQLRRAADRAEMIPAITNYMAALSNALVVGSAGGDVQGAKKNYESRKYELQSRLAGTDVATDVKSGVTRLLDGGQALLDKVMSTGVPLRDLVAGYTLILLPAEDAINGSVRVDSERIRAETEGLSRAVGARGQMMMQELLVNRGGELPEPQLRTSMMTVAGTEPSTLFGISQVLGVDSPDAKKLQQLFVGRMTLMSDPTSALAGNPDLLHAIHATDEIANQVIKQTTGAVTKSVEDQAADRRNAAIRDTILVLVALAIALGVVLWVARSLVAPLRTLRDSALKVAHTDLEDEIARVRAGDDRAPVPLPVYTTEEVGQVAHAVDELHAQALLLAGDEARLRLLVNDMFETMSRRNRSLVDQQLTLIDRLERNEDDPDRLDSLFRLDHLAARMRRNGANLLVLAGAQISHEKGRSVPLATVIDAATSEVEDYRRVETTIVPDATVTGAATGDTVHLLAELIDNALRYSPPASPVRVSAVQTDDAGVRVEISDTGLGMTEADLRIANMRLGADSEVSPENARHMGLFVVSRLAQRHGVDVQLRATPGGSGITAEVYLPPSLLVGAAGQTELPRRGAPTLTLASAAPADAEESTPVADDAQRNGVATSEATVSLLPQRRPGSSGITGAPEQPSSPAAEEPKPQRELPRPWWEKDVGQAVEEPAAAAPSNTAAYFSSRSRTNGAASAQEPDTAAGPDLRDMDALAAELAAPPAGSSGDLIYQRMLSEWLVDPHELARSADLDWKTVWDHGWSVAAEVENVPVASHTEQGLPVREPGARLVPGAANPEPAPAANGTLNGADQRYPVASNGGFGTGYKPRHEARDRDPDAIRASISSHFGGVRRGRSHARQTSQGSDHE
ncbi:ATP-binding protein [Mycobacterium sp. pUA109]|uniref:ATP-binding protein n=1 Tax=Mycobacterium sp. pUA109 TaxID=3238982 RepID=UPI00351B7ABD